MAQRIIRNESPLVVEQGGKFVPLAGMNKLMPFWLGIDSADQNSLPMTLAAAGTPSSPFHFKAMQQESYPTPFLGKQIVFEDGTDGTAAANWSVQMLDADNRRLSNYPVHVRCLAGTAQLPFKLVEPLIIPSLAKVEVQCRKITGAATVMRMHLGGCYPIGGTPNTQRIQNWLKRRSLVLPYWFTVCDGSLGWDVGGVQVGAGVGTSTQVTMKVENGSFDAYKLMAIASADFYMAVLDPKTGVTLFNGQISQTNGIGTALWPLDLTPWFVAKNSELRFTLVNTSASANNVFLALHGKLYMSEMGKPEEAAKGVAIDDFEE